MRRSFSLRQKLSILADQDSQGLSNNEVCRRYRLQLHQLNAWRSSASAYREHSKSARRIRPLGVTIYSEYEDALLAYIYGRRDQRAIVTVRSIIWKLNEICPGAAGKTENSKRLWVYRFMKRRNLSLRRVTRAVHHADSELDRRRQSFFQAVEAVYFANPRTVFVNMDQTAVEFGAQGRLTVDTRGVQSVAVDSPSNTTFRATALLSVTSTGEKLEPFLVFKGTLNGRITRELSSRGVYPAGVRYAVQANAWTDEGILHRWLREVLLPAATRYGAENTCLVLDSFRIHLMDSVRDYLLQAQIKCIIIPGGLTAELQPLDVGINGPLKHWLRERWSFREGLQSLTAAEKRLEIAQAVQSCWGAIEADSVINSFDAMLRTVSDNIELLDRLDYDE